MPFTAIKGTFHVKGYSPDGDSIRFQADDDANWQLLHGARVNLNPRGHAQLRFEVIDTLETHYLGQHQPLKFAKKATDRVLAELNITDVVWNAAETEVQDANDGTAGFVLSRTIDSYGRPVVFVFNDDVELTDGVSIFLDDALLRQSINFKMLEAGLAYATFHEGLYPELRASMTEATIKARRSRKGLWPFDKTNLGVKIGDLSSITDVEGNIILPELFRCLVVHLVGGRSIERFKDQPSTRQRRVFIVPSSRDAYFDNLVSVDGNTVSIMYKPEELVFY